MHLPFLPLKLVAIDLEANALGLDDMQRLDVLALPELLALLLRVRSEQVRQEVAVAERRRDALAARGLQRVRVERRIWLPAISGVEVHQLHLRSGN